MKRLATRSLQAINVLVLFLLALGMAAQAQAQTQSPMLWLKVNNAGTELELYSAMDVATCPVHGESREPLLDAADKAMYRAKSEGRNRVSSANELSDAARSSD